LNGLAFTALALSPWIAVWLLSRKAKTLHTSQPAWVVPTVVGIVVIAVIVALSSLFVRSVIKKGNKEIIDRIVREALKAAVLAVVLAIASTAGGFALSHYLDRPAPPNNYYGTVYNGPVTKTTTMNKGPTTQTTVYQEVFCKPQPHQTGTITAVPPLLGDTTAQAVAALAPPKLTVVINDVPWLKDSADTVVAQWPPQNCMVPEQSVVTIDVAESPWPSMVG